MPHTDLLPLGLSKAKQFLSAIWRSAREFVFGLVIWSVVLAIGLTDRAFWLKDLLETILGRPFEMPTCVSDYLDLILVGIVFIASFALFHRVRVQRDELRDRLAEYESADATNTSPRESLTLREAIEWIIANTGLEQESDSRPRNLRVAIDRLENAMMHRNLLAWGKRLGSDQFERIPSLYWAGTGTVDYKDLWSNSVSPGRTVPGRINIPDIPVYEEVRLRESEVRSIWPER